MATIESICKKHGLILIEDCAQSFGAKTCDRMTGAIGAFGCFSFFPSKNLGCYGDGGMVTTNSPELAEQIRILRNHGSQVRYHHKEIGYNSRLDEIQAVVLRAKLKHIEEYNAGRQRVAQLYTEMLKDSAVTTPHVDGKGVHVFHQYTVLTDNRDKIIEALTDARVASAIYYPIPLHRQEVFATDYRDISLPVAEEISGRCLSLPIFPEMTDAQVREVVAVIKAVARS
jgi:dTDP-4-amino-4,6-dideoxygalactose transaminase